MKEAYTISNVSDLIERLSENKEMQMLVHSHQPHVINLRVVAFNIVEDVAVLLPWTNHIPEIPMQCNTGNRRRSRTGKAHLLAKNRRMEV